MGDVRAILCGYYGKGNGGDEALLASLLQMLPSQVQPIVLSGNPQATYDRYGVITCDRNSAFRVLEAMGESEYFIWGGGSLMQDTTSWRSPLYYGGLMGLAQQRGLKTIAWAQGIGPLKRSFTRWLTRQTLLGCVGVSVRDKASAQLLQQWQINPLLAPDPVWALTPQPYPGLGDIHAPRVAVILRPHPRLTRQRLNHLTQALISFQKATDTSLLLLPFHPAQDLEMAEAVAQQLPGIHSILTPDTPQQLMGIFDGVEMAIGMRLHGLIMAASQQCRCFALSYDPKVSQLMEDLDLPGWELEEIPDDPNVISKAWLDYYANGLPLEVAQIESLRDRAALHGELLNNW
ncbi:polysaccharide pyruvyl transferase CsaB [Spirulina sp. CS-785/01]|uniref:polysaccharide pyruvyl transferase CsaB n=1 Tax=Spirulina sp. CS-785/01 TaxID=3021716 RepID=UPI0023309911|nr:polysaccharide pyruvyl transferase CsaB [Spirulina sp. CS-785/01]MDB9315451.1 polysaccharide pyruvyl transferase CsaB [Spirulina sp. CS-785/01]